MQTQFIFPTDSPINIERLSGQNKRLYDFLNEGGKINCFSEEMRKLGIGRLNSRISDLKNKFGIGIEREFISINGLTIAEYKIKNNG